MAPTVCYISCVPERCSVPGRLFILQIYKPISGWHRIKTATRTATIPKTFVFLLSIESNAILAKYMNTNSPNHVTANSNKKDRMPFCTDCKERIKLTPPDTAILSAWSKKPYFLSSLIKLPPYPKMRPPSLPFVKIPNLHRTTVLLQWRQERRMLWKTLIVLPWLFSVSSHRKPRTN